MKPDEKDHVMKAFKKEVLKEKMVSPNTIVLTLQKHKTLFERIEK